MTTRDKGITLPAQYPYTDVSSAAGFRVTDLPNDYTSIAAYNYGANYIQPVNLFPIALVAPQSFTVKSQTANPAFAAVGGNLNIVPGAGSGGNISGVVNIQDTAGNGGGWNTAHIKMGYHLWIDSAGRLRIKATAPTGDTDGNVVGFDLVGSAVYDPPNLADGAGTTTTIAVANAVMGDFAIASFSLDLQGISVTAWISAINTVSIRFQNESGGALDLASGTLKVKVIKQ